MRVAKNAAAVVSAVTVVLDVASQVSSLKESMGDRSEDSARTAPRKSAPAKKRPSSGGARQSNGAARPAAKAHAASSANGSTNRRKD